MAAYPHLFLPLKVGSHFLKNRIVMAPVETGLEKQDYLDPRVVEFYEERARGQAHAFPRPSDDDRGLDASGQEAVRQKETGRPQGRPKNVWRERNVWYRRRRESSRCRAHAFGRPSSP